MGTCSRAIDYFNPRPCTRSDTLSEAGYAAEEISTHAPARGATF